MVDEYLRGLEAGLAQAGLEGVDVLDPSTELSWEVRTQLMHAHEPGFRAVYQALAVSDCPREVLVAELPLDEMSVAGRGLLMGQLAQLAIRFDVANLPPDARELADAIPSGGDEVESPVVAGNPPGELSLLVLVAEGDEACECYEDLMSALATQTLLPALEVRVVDSGPVSWDLAERWDLVLASVEELELDLTVIPTLRPAAVILKEGRTVAGLSGLSEIADPWSMLRAGTYPLDRLMEPVDAALLGGGGTCDGHRAAGVIVNSTDRPIHAAVSTDPAVSFDTAGIPESREVWHDLGEIEPYGYAKFDVLTGEDFLAPCLLLPTAVYTDGEFRGSGYEPGPPPPGFSGELEDLVDMTMLPERVVPSGAFPSPRDVKPLDDF